MSSILYNQLFDFQKEILNTRGEMKSLGLFLDMGLGKTITSLALCEKNNVDKIIVISIKSKATESVDIKYSFDYYLDMLGFKIYKKEKNKFNTTGFSANGEKEAIVINYESLHSPGDKENLHYLIHEFITANKGKRFSIILDESHFVKNKSTNRAKLVEKLINLCRLCGTLYLYLLTGTPFTRGYIDLFNQLKLLGLSMSLTKFKNNFCLLGDVKGLYSWQQPIIGYKDKDGLFSLVKMFAITALTESNIKLPEQVFVNITYPTTDEFNLLVKRRLPKKKIIHLLDKHNLPYGDERGGNLSNPFYRNLSAPDIKWYAGTAANFWLRSRQISIGFQGSDNDYTWYNYKRLELLRNFLSENVDNYILFYNYTPEFYEIFKVCEELGYKIDVYNGEIKDLYFYDEYSNMSDNEQFNNKKRIIISNYTSGGTGKNWQLYNKTIFFSVPLYGVYAQSLKRNHRIGQKNTVYYYTFYQDNVLDNSMLESLKNQSEYNAELFLSTIDNLE